MEWLVIGISGVTCGGKTTLAHSLLEYLQSHHNLSLWPKPYKVGMVRMLSQDNYFLPVEDERHRWLQQINAINFELLTSLDMKQMLNDISWIMCGNIMNKDQQQLQQQQQQQQQPNEYQLMLHNQQQQQQQQQPQQMYQQSQQQQQTSTYYNNNNNKAKNLKHNNNNNKSSLQLQQQQQQHKVFQQQIEQQQNNDKIINILIIEGFIIFNQPDLYQLCNIKYHFHLPYEKCYERRQKRTYDPPDVTGYFELCVWPYYEKSLAEYRYHKDIIYLNGEIDRERIFKYVLKQISAYFNESQNTLDVVAVVDSTKTTTPATATRNVKQLETIVNLNLRMLRHQQQPLVLQQHMLQMQQHKPQQQQQHEQYQRYQQHQQQLSSSQQQQQQQQQMCATGMQQ